VQEGANVYLCRRDCDGVRKTLGAEWSANFLAKGGPEVRIGPRTMLLRVHRHEASMIKRARLIGQRSPTSKEKTTRRTFHPNFNQLWDYRSDFRSERTVKRTAPLQFKGNRRLPQQMNATSCSGMAKHIKSNRVRSCVHSALLHSGSRRFVRTKLRAQRKREGERERESCENISEMIDNWG
jgi:hypothetical protein